MNVSIIDGHIVINVPSWCLIKGKGGKNFCYLGKDDAIALEESLSQAIQEILLEESNVDNEISSV